MSTEFTIEKGIPVPPLKNAANSLRDFLLTMEPGDSFVYKESNTKTHSDQSSIRHAAKRAGVKLTIRQVEGESFRVWRIQ